MSEKSNQPENSLNTCPTCGNLIPEEAPQGLCPRCVLNVAAVPTDSGSLTMPYPRFHPPSLDAVREAFPQFEIVDLIGCGGMGAVYRARQTHLDRLVALKILPLDLAEAPGFTERFTREGQVLARLNHPNIVSVFDFGESGGFFFLLMEYVDGVNLRQEMKAGRFTPQQALEIVPPICEALQFAHDEGILHRDIKPENILLDTRGRVKIADFGIAKLLGEVADTRSALTRGASPGTPQYMAPEQIEHPDVVDHRADIYSLGVVFYEMLTGELPIGRFAPPSERTGVGSEVDDIVFRSLEKERDRRQQSASQMRTEVTSVPQLTGVPRQSPVPSPSVPVEKYRRRFRPGLALALTFGGVVILVVLNQLEGLQSSKSKSRDAVADRSMSVVEQRTANEVMMLRRELAQREQPVRADESAEINTLKTELAVYEKQEERLKGNIKVKQEFSWVPLVAFFVSMLGLAMIFMVPSTVFAWKQLRLQRILGIRKGRVALLAAAWFWPMIWLYVLFQLFFFPLRMVIIVGAIASPLALMMTLLHGALFIWLTWRKSTQPMETSAAVRYLANLPEEEANGFRPRPLLQWSGVGLGLLMVFPVVVFLGILLQDSALHLNIGVTSGRSVGTILFSIAYLFLIKRIYQLPQAKLAGEPATGLWPQRIFRLIILIFVGPATIVGISLLVPKVIYAANLSPSTIRGDYGVAVSKVTMIEERPTMEIEWLRRTPGSLEGIIVFSATDKNGMPLEREGTAAEVRDDGVISIGQKSGISLRDRRQRGERISFEFQDSDRANQAFNQLTPYSKRHGPKAPVYANLDRLPLFDVTGPEGNRYRAWIEFAFTRKAESSSPH
ncbi:MAG: protein kinase [Verrucomicrobiales bacterium]|nr:protein kinase [Verrucomicrobiales bacterium]